MSTLWISMIGCGETEVKKSEDKLSDNDTLVLDTPSIYKTWVTPEDEYFQFGFTIHENGFLEFLQWDYTTGKLTNPFTLRDSIFFDSKYSEYGLYLKNCYGGWFLGWYFENGFFRGNILELTDSTLVIDQFIAIGSPNGLKFLAADSNSVRKVNRQMYSANWRYSEARPYNLFNREFILSPPATYTREVPKGMLNKKTGELTINLLHIPEPCVLGNSFNEWLEFRISNFYGKGDYLSTDSALQTSIRGFVSDVIWKFVPDSAKVQVISYDSVSNRIHANFEVRGLSEQEDIDLEITNGEFDFYLNEN